MNKVKWVVILSEALVVKVVSEAFLALKGFRICIEVKQVVNLLEIYLMNLKSSLVEVEEGLVEVAIFQALKLKTQNQTTRLHRPRPILCR